MVIARRALRRPPWGGRPAYRAGFCSSASAPPRPAGGRRAVADPVTRRGEFDECRFDLLDFGFGLFFQAHQRIPGGLVDPDQFVELELERLRVAILSVLDNEDHKKRHDRRARIDDELPGIGPVKEGARHRPQGHDKDRQHKGGRATELLLNPARKAGEDHAL
jgi:hypothetical protein